MVLKGVPSSGTGVEVEKLWWEKAILDFEVRRLFYKQNYDREFSRQNYLGAIADLEV